MYNNALATIGKQKYNNNLIVQSYAFDIGNNAITITQPKYQTYKNIVLREALNLLKMLGDEYMKMRKFIKWGGFLLLCSLLVACNFNENKEKASFIGVIESMNDKSAIVKVEESENNDLVGTVRIHIPDNLNETFEVGDKIRVGYNGEVLEISPLQVTVITIKKIE